MARKIKRKIVEAVIETTVIGTDQAGWVKPPGAANDASWLRDLLRSELIYANGYVDLSPDADEAYRQSKDDVDRFCKKELKVKTLYRNRRLYYDKNGLIN